MVLGKTMRLTRVSEKTGMPHLPFVRALNHDLVALFPNPDREGSPGEGNRVFLPLPAHPSLPADRAGSGKSHPIGRNRGTGGQSLLPEPVDGTLSGGPMDPDVGHTSRFHRSSSSLSCVLSRNRRPARKFLLTYLTPLSTFPFVRAR